MLTKEKQRGLASGGRLIKGVVYLLSGGLVISALGKNIGVDPQGNIQSWPFAKTLLIIIIVGVFLYALYRIYQGVSDPGRAGLLVSIGYILSGVFYFFLGFTCLNEAFGWGGFILDLKDSILASILNSPAGKYASGFGGVVFSGKSGFQFYKAFSGRSQRRIDEANIDKGGKRLLKKMGKVGYVGRGIVIAIIGFVLFRVWKDPSYELKLFEGPFGRVLMVVVGVGLLAYGILMFVKSKYGSMDVSER